METVEFIITYVECTKCGYAFQEGDIIYHNEGYLDETDIMANKCENPYCEECKDFVFCEDCGELHEECNCV